MNREKAERYLKIGLFGAVLTLIGDFLIGAAQFPDGANMIDGYFALALAMPVWRPVMGGLIGFVGQIVFNAVRQPGNTAPINGIGTPDKSLGAIVMLTALLLGGKKYAGDKEWSL